MRYDDAIGYLDRHIDLERSTAIAGKVEGLKLDRMQALCDVLGDPQRAAPVIHLTGTNGKGSTARMVSALLMAHGLSIGTYTSPHLERVNERLARDLVPIDDADFADVMAAVADAEPLAGVEPSYFELLTAGAFYWFAHLPVDVMVVEVGLLGRWDATNVADGAVAVLTNVGRDHTDGRGDWRRRIAEEKSGIVKPGSTFVLGEPDPALRPVFEAAGAERMWVRDQDFGVVASRRAVGGRVIDLRTPGAHLEDLYLPLHGEHQVDNAAAAVAAVEAFFDRPLSNDVVADAFASVTLPCRFEVVSHQPLVVLDGAHNPDGARTLAATLAEEFTVAGRRRFVLGILGGRDVRDMATALALQPDDVITTCTPGSPRALDARDLARELASMGLDASPAPSVDGALQDALDVAAEGDLVMVTGSLYTAGDARAACRRLGIL